jgi:formamidopyrimidine-DNA glycosylase
MPELPDVESFRRYIDRTSLKQKIEKVEIFNKKVLRGASITSIGKALKGKKFTATYRHGKYLFLETDSSASLVFHFGMTGYPIYEKSRIAGDETGDETEKHRQLRFLVEFDNGGYLGFVNMRLLGRVDITKDIDRYIGDVGLGPDAASVDEETFVRVIGSTKGMLKSTFMNQGKIAGLGNIYVDELLFQTGLHPRTKSDALTDDQLGNLYRTLKKVIEQSLEADADIERLPEHYLIPHRKPGNPCPRCSGSIEKKTIAGRSTYFCPECQIEIL